ncbi:MAG: restriction endonuclease subunit R, partial [Candidatus Saccharimonadales bacterium]
FELHHIVPLSWSENIHHFRILDKWQNMVYIDAFSHAKITQNHNRNVVLDTKEEDITLSDYSNSVVYLKNKENIIYQPKNQSVMKKYNTELLNTVT